MSSVEGMWKFQSGNVAEPNTLRWGGIVVLESGRVFGGDSVMAYLGTYSVDRDQIAADVRSWRWNFDIQEDVVNAFGMTGEMDHPVKLIAMRNGDVIEGFISDENFPGVRLAARLEKIAELP